MTRSVSKRSSAVLGICLVLALATVALANHSWNGYHWARESNPFTLKLGDNVDSNWDPVLATASFEWTKSLVLDTTIVTGNAGNPRRCRATSGRVEVCNSTYGNNGWLGIAQIWVTGGVHITQGIVKLNDTYFNTAQYNTLAWRRLVTCQEVGHTFGLDHQDENMTNPNLGTCMDYTNDPDGPASNEYPNTHDYQQLETIYAHLDSFTTLNQVTQMPPAMTQIDLEGPGQWGREVSASAGHSVYESDFGNGFKVITHVTWAVEPARGRSAQ